MNLILASQSPRRKQLLSQLGLEFEIKVADIDETMDSALSPKVEVARLSLEKAQEISKDCLENTLVIAADTIVVFGDKVLGKPRDCAHASQMLTTLSGQTHVVLTAVSLVCGQQVDTFVEETSVTFRELSPQEIDYYVASGEPLDKAGSYGIQGLGGAFVSAIGGDYYNVMGLPICALTQHLWKFGVAVFGQK